MNTISKEDVVHIAHLARINLTTKEVERFTNELSAILEYVRQLQEVDTRGVPETVQVTGNANVLRDDVVYASSSTMRDALLHAIPVQEAGHVKVKAVFQ